MYLCYYKAICYSNVFVNTIQKGKEMDTEIGME